MSAGAVQVEPAIGRAAGKIVVGAVTADLPARSGFQRYTVEMVRQLLQLDPDLIALAASPALRESFGDRVRLSSFRGIAQGNFRGNLSRLLWHQTAAPVALRRESAGVFYSTAPDGMIAPACPQVITIHDVAPLRFPESSPRLRHYVRFVVPRIIAASRAIIATSEATRRDIQSFFRVGDRPIHVVYQGYRADVFRPVADVEVRATKKQLGLERFVLAVGEARPYKNLRGLIEAFARLPRSELQLAIVGRLGRLEDDLPELPRTLGIQDRVKWLGYVPDAELAALYSGAVALAFPSLFEGFGIPPLEAMACGCPVVASRAGSIPEVCGDAAVYFDPRDVEDMAAAVHHLASTPALQAELRQKGLQRAQQFSYRTAAEQVLGILRSCLA